jgi:hypothetical protein
VGAGKKTTGIGFGNTDGKKRALRPWQLLGRSVPANISDQADTKTDTNEEWRRSSEEWQSIVEKPAKLGLNGSDLAA